jgi:hypothetical protein
MTTGVQMPSCPTNGRPLVLRRCTRMTTRCTRRSRRLSPAFPALNSTPWASQGAPAAAPAFRSPHTRGRIARPLMLLSPSQAGPIRRTVLNSPCSEANLEAMRRGEVKWDPYTADNFTTMRGAIEAADTAWVDVLKIDIEGALPTPSCLGTELTPVTANHSRRTRSCGQAAWKRIVDCADEVLSHEACQLLFSQTCFNLPEQQHAWSGRLRQCCCASSSRCCQLGTRLDWRFDQMSELASGTHLSQSAKADWLCCTFPWGPALSRQMRT